jgi:hypothetical protein
MGFYIPEDGIRHRHLREQLKSYITLPGWALYLRRNVSPVKYELGLYISEDCILHFPLMLATCTNAVCLCCEH